MLCIVLVPREGAARFDEPLMNQRATFTRNMRILASPAHEQLAADVFFPDEPRLTAALGFLGAGTYDSSAAGTAPKSFENLDRDDLVTQTMAAFVSTTATCAAA